MLSKPALPFDYEITKLYLAHKYKRDPTDPSFEDQYHDCLETFLRHWNGNGNPVGAVSLYWTQWYSQRAANRRAAMESLDVEIDVEDTTITVKDLLEDEDNCPYLLLVQEVQDAIMSCSKYQQDVAVKIILGYSYQDVATEYGVTRQAIEQLHRKVTKKILEVL